MRYRRGPQNIGHGSDKVANFTWLQRQAFQDLGIPFTEEELDLHLMGSTIFKVKPTVARVRALRRWYDRLLALNAEQGFAPRKAFTTGGTAMEQTLPLPAPLWPFRCFGASSPQLRTDRGPADLRAEIPRERPRGKLPNG